MLVTPSGIVIFVKASQEEKALFPMLVKLSGIVILVKYSQLENASSPIFLIPCGIS